MKNTIGFNKKKNTATLAMASQGVKFAGRKVGDSLHKLISANINGFQWSFQGVIHHILVKIPYIEIQWKFH